MTSDGEEGGLSEDKEKWGKEEEHEASVLRWSLPGAEPSMRGGADMHN